MLCRPVQTGTTSSHGSSCYLPGKRSGAPTVFSLKRKPVACCFWIQCLLTAVWRRIPPYVLALHSFLCLQSWYASPNIFTVLCHAQTPQIPFWNGFVSLYTWISRSLIMSLPLITWGKFKQMQRHKNLALLWAGWLVLHIYIVLFKSGGKKISVLEMSMARGSTCWHRWLLKSWDPSFQIGNYIHS